MYHAVIVHLVCPPRLTAAPHSTNPQQTASEGLAGHGGRLLGLAGPEYSLPTVAGELLHRDARLVFFTNESHLSNDLECPPHAPHVYG